jgi:hypothetical protein
MRSLGWGLWRRGVSKRCRSKKQKWADEMARKGRTFGEMMAYGVRIYLPKDLCAVQR